LINKRALEEDEEGREARKNILMEEFKIILKFKVGHEITSVSPITVTTGLKKAIGGNRNGVGVG